MALLGTAEQIDDIPAPIRAIFRHEINLPTPGTIPAPRTSRCFYLPSTHLSPNQGVEVRLRQLTRLFARTPLAPDVELPDVARKTASFVGRELRSLHAHAAATALARAVRGTDQVSASKQTGRTPYQGAHQCGWCHRTGFAVGGAATGGGLCGGRGGHGRGHRGGHRQGLLAQGFQHLRTQHPQHSGNEWSSPAHTTTPSAQV